MATRPEVGAVVTSRDQTARATGSYRFRATNSPIGMLADASL